LSALYRDGAAIVVRGEALCDFFEQRPGRGKAAQLVFTVGNVEHGRDRGIQAIALAELRARISDECG
jgi:hypothetical protein